MLIFKANKTRGFTLLELTIALIIAGLVVTPSLHLYTVNKKREQLDITKKETFAIQPADPAIAMIASELQ